MNMAATFGQAISEVDQLIIGQAHELSDKLKQHRLEMFPPVARKGLRQFQLSEAAHFLGVTSGYLRNLSLESKGPLPQVTPSGRRSYTAQQLQEMREYLEQNSRGQRYVPRRRGAEHLQVIAVVNFKGGSGKTTTTAHLAQHLALTGHRVLAVDLDPQASLSAIHGFQPEFDVDENETLDGSYQGELADTMYSPPDRDPGTDRWGTTAFEESQGESLDQLLSEEEPDVFEQEAPLDDADPRAGRLVAENEGIGPDEEKDEVATDAGFAGSAASAEEAAVHVVDEDDAPTSDDPDGYITS